MRIDWSSFWEQERHDVEWLIADVLARGRGHAFFAWQKTGKSLLLLALLTELVLRDPNVVILYFDYEMTEADVYERLCDMGHGPKTDFSRLYYDLLPDMDPLDTRQGAATLLRTVDEVQQAHPGKHLVVVLDTMGRAVSGEENSADTIREFYRHTGLGLKKRVVTWARLDHAGKDREKGQRGTSAKGDDVDIVWRIEKQDGGLILNREAARMSWVPAKVAFQIVQEPSLHFSYSPQVWPVGTQELMTLLDDLKVPVGCTIKMARDALTKAEIKRRNTVLSAAVRARKQGLELREQSREQGASVTPLRPTGTVGNKP